MKLKFLFVYKIQINEGETVINNQWLKQKKGLEEKPQNEIAIKIVVSNATIYAKSQERQAFCNKSTHPFLVMSGIAGIDTWYRYLGIERGIDT